MEKKNPIDELRREMNEKFAALRALQMGTSPAGHMAYKCVCGNFATVETRTNHPVAGMRAYLLCDHCEPPRLEFDRIGTTESMDFSNAYWTPEDNAWARQMNTSLNFR